MTRLYNLIGCGPFLLLILTVLSQAVAGANGFAPTSRNIKPNSVFRTTGNVRHEPHLSSFAYTLSGPNASVTFDFGQETAGLPSLRYYNSTCGILPCQSLGLPAQSCIGPCQGLGLAYSESAQFSGPASDLSTIYFVQDGIVYLPILNNKHYEIPAKWARGGFRYLTLSLGNQIASSTSVTVALDNLYYTAAPKLGHGDLNQYTGYFNSSDPELNSIWLAGAYTLQLNTISANSSVNHLYVATGGGWSQDSTATGLNGSDVFLADGAKRDRNAWAGDGSISLRSALVAQNYNNVVAVRNLLRECIILQDSDPLSTTYGYFPYAGSPLGDLLKLVPLVIPPYGSDTYHLHTMNVFAEYVMATNDAVFLTKYWPQILKGISATYHFVDTDGLFNGTRTLDWGRTGQGGKNGALNALYYATLSSLVLLTKAYPQGAPAQDNAQKWSSMAQRLKVAFNSQLWDAKKGLYRDNTTSSGAALYPQDGNSFAIEYNLTDSSATAKSVAKGLASRLTSFGAPSPELPGSVSPFIGSHELISQFKVAELTGDVSSALSLIRMQWGYMRRAFSNASFVEGYGSDGSLNYGFYGGKPEFVSHAHAWSTGPVYGLVNDVVGIRATALDVPSSDGQWAVKPTGALGDLSWASGGIKVLRGAFDVKWQNCEKSGFEMTVNSPVGLPGTIYVPTFGSTLSKVCVLINGKKPASRLTLEGPFIRVAEVSGGITRVQLKLRPC